MVARFVFLLLTFLLIGSGGASARQGGAAPIVGPSEDYQIIVVVRYKDKSVSGAKVSIYYATNAAFALDTQTTSADGRVTFTLKEAGKYLVEVKHDEYVTMTREVEVYFKTNPPSAYFNLKSKSVRIMATVIDDDTGEPISGAMVNGVAEGTATRNQVATDDSGSAAILIDLTGRSALLRGTTVTVTASHPEYESQTGTVAIEEGGREKDYSAPFRLKRKKGLRSVIVNVFEVGTKAPIAGAVVKLDGGTSGYATGTTNGVGHAVIAVKGNTVFALTVSSSYYDAVSDSIDFTGEDAPKSVTRRYELTKKASVGAMLRMAHVHVQGKKADGTLVNLKGATVTLSGGQSGTTNDSGDVDFLHSVPPGELISATATPTGNSFKNGAGSTAAGVRGVMYDEKAFEKWKWLKEWRDGNPITRALHPDFVSKWKTFFGLSVQDTVVVTCPAAKGDHELDGSVVPNKGRAKVGEKVNVAFRLLYKASEQPDSVVVTDNIELFGPGGKKITQSTKRRTLKRNAAYDSRYVNIVCQQPGTYTVRASAKGGILKEWKGEASFDVSGKAAEKPKPKEPEKEKNFTGLWEQSGSPGADYAQVSLVQTGNTVTGIIRRREKGVYEGAGRIYDGVATRVTSGPGAGGWKLVAKYEDLGATGTLTWYLVPAHAEDQVSIPELIRGNYMHQLRRLKN